MTTTPEAPHDINHHDTTINLQRAEIKRLEKLVQTLMDAVSVHKNELAALRQQPPVSGTDEEVIDKFGNELYEYSRSCRRGHIACPGEIDQIVRKYWPRPAVSPVDSRERTFSEEKPPVGMVIEYRNQGDPLGKWWPIKYQGGPYSSGVIWRPITLPPAAPTPCHKCAELQQRIEFLERQSDCDLKAARSLGLTSGNSVGDCVTVAAARYRKQVAELQGEVERLKFDIAEQKRTIDVLADQANRTMSAENAGKRLTMEHDLPSRLSRDEVAEVNRIILADSDDNEDPGHELSKMKEHNPAFAEPAADTTEDPETQTKIVQPPTGTPAEIVDVMALLDSLARYGDRPSHAAKIRKAILAERASRQPPAGDVPRCDLESLKVAAGYLTPATQAHFATAIREIEAHRQREATLADMPSPGEWREAWIGKPADSTDPRESWLWISRESCQDGDCSAAINDIPRRVLVAFADAGEGGGKS